MRLGLVVLLGGLVVGAPAAAEEGRRVPRVAELSWLAGCWRIDGEAAVVQECWLEERGGLMVGVGRTVKDDGSTFFEFLRLADSDTGPVYWASPEGREAVPFAAVEIGPRSVVFENPRHDFPQRIFYRLDEAGALHAGIAGLDGTEGRSEWVYERTGADWEPPRTPGYGSDPPPSE